MTEAEPKTSEGVPEASAYPEFPTELRARLVERDPEALERFFEAYFDRIYGYVRRLVGNVELAEDLTQDIFMHLYQGFSKYDPARDLRPWVFTIATNKVRDFWRSRQHRDSLREKSVERGDDDWTYDPPAETPKPEELLTREEVSARLREVVEELPDGLRMTVLLRAYEGLSFEAIGEILGRNEVAVRKRYSRALEVLRNVLSREISEGT